jgi:hypothetical protein
LAWPLLFEAFNTTGADMPMRGELGVPARRSEISKDSLLPIFCFCSIGLLMTLYFALSQLPFDQLPLLVAQYNLFG